MSKNVRSKAWSTRRSINYIQPVFSKHLPRVVSKEGRVASHQHQHQSTTLPYGLSMVHRKPVVDCRNGYSTKLTVVPQNCHRMLVDPALPKMADACRIHPSGVRVLLLLQRTAVTSIAVSYLIHSHAQLTPRSSQIPASPCILLPANKVQGTFRYECESDRSRRKKAHRKVDVRIKLR